MLAPAVRWDAHFYIFLSRHGYPESPPDGRPVYAVAFFPAYPVAINLATRLMGDSFIAAMLVSNVCAAAATCFLFLLVRRRSTSTLALKTVILWLASPGSHFLSLPYAEGLFCCALFGSFLLLALNRIWLAAFAGAVASGTRSAGVVVAMALLLMAVSEARRAPRCQWARIAWRYSLATAVSLTGLVAFALYCQRRYHDVLAFAHIQSHYNRALSLLGPLKALWSFSVDPDYYVVTIVAIGLCVWAVRRPLPAVEKLAASFLVVLPLMTGTLKAMIRYQSANGFIHAFAARLLRGRKFTAITATSLAMMAMEAFLYSRGNAHY